MISSEPPCPPFLRRYVAGNGVFLAHWIDEVLAFLAKEGVDPSQFEPA
jgi:hypothetical protein